MAKIQDVVIQAILNGRLDDKFEEMQDAMTLRRRRQAATLKKGDIVVLNGKGTSYLRGYEAEITKVPTRRNAKNFTVKLVNYPEENFRGGQFIICPPTLFELKEKVSG